MNWVLARVVLIALAGGVIGRWLAGFSLGVLEPLLLGVGLVDPTPWGWAGSFPVLGGGFLPDYLLGACGGAALTLHALLAGWLARRRVRHALAVVATLAGAGSIQVLFLATTQPSWLLWNSVIGLGFASAILGGVAATSPPAIPSEFGGPRRAWTLVGIATLCLGLPTLSETWARHSPKDYPPATLEFAVLSEFRADPPEAEYVMATLKLDSGDLLLVREPGEGLVEIHLDWKATGQLLELTRNNVGRSLSIRVDGVEQTRPTIRSVIAKGHLVIAQRTPAEGRELLLRLTQGPQ